MLLSEIRPFVRQALHTRIDKTSHSHLTHPLRCADCRLFFIHSGTGRIVFPDAAFSLRPGMVILFQAGQEYHWEMEELEYEVINFDYTQSHAHITRTFHPIRAEHYRPADCIERVTFSDETLLNRPAALHNAGHLESAFRSLTLEYALGGQHSRLLLSFMLSELLLRVVRALHSGAVPTADGSGIEGRVLDYIHAHYARPIGVSDIAEALSFTPAYLNRVFKKRAHRTIHEALREYRLDRSAELLSLTNATVTEIMTRCGFLTLPYFTKCFKLRFGVSPTQYRARRLPSPSPTEESPLT